MKKQVYVVAKNKLEKFLKARSVPKIGVSKVTKSQDVLFKRVLKLKDKYIGPKAENQTKAI